MDLLTSETKLDIQWEGTVFDVKMLRSETDWSSVKPFGQVSFQQSSYVLEADTLTTWRKDKSGLVQSSTGLKSTCQDKYLGSSRTHLKWDFIFRWHCLRSIMQNILVNMSVQDSTWRISTNLTAKNSKACRGLIGLLFIPIIRAGSVGTSYCVRRPYRNNSGVVQWR